MSLAIKGLGTAVPATRIKQEESEQLALALAFPTEERATWLSGMYNGTGIRSRNIWFPQQVVDDVLKGTNISGSSFIPKGEPDDRGPTTEERMQLYSEEAKTLSQKATKAALGNAQISPQEITHLVTVSCTGFNAPGFDIALINEMNLPRTIERTHVGYMGCHGALNGMRVANAIMKAEPEACVLLCAVELCSLHYFYGWDPQKMIANALFADGAAAIVGVPADTAPRDTWKVLASGSCVFPDSADAMTWTIGDNGFYMTLSRRVPDQINAGLRPWLTKWLSQRQLTIDDIKSWAVHPGGPKILDATEDALGLDRNALRYSREVLAEHGNMSSPTVLFILQRMMEERAPRPCVALGFGPGLTAEAALLS